MPASPATPAAIQHQIGQRTAQHDRDHMLAPQALAQHELGRLLARPIATISVPLMTKPVKNADGNMRPVWFSK